MLRYVLEFFFHFHLQISLWQFNLAESFAPDTCPQFVAKGKFPSLRKNLWLKSLHYTPSFSNWNYRCRPFISGNLGKYSFLFQAIQFCVCLRTTNAVKDRSGFKETFAVHFELTSTLLFYPSESLYHLNTPDAWFKIISILFRTWVADVCETICCIFLDFHSKTNLCNHSCHRNVGTATWTTFNSNKLWLLLFSTLCITPIIFSLV